jgi:hypothetical protein
MVETGIYRMDTNGIPPGLADVIDFPLIEALLGRRGRRFSLGASIPDGPLAFTHIRASKPGSLFYVGNISTTGGIILLG